MPGAKGVGDVAPALGAIEARLTRAVAQALERAGLDPDSLRAGKRARQHGGGIEATASQAGGMLWHRDDEIGGRPGDARRRREKQPRDERLGCGLEADESSPRILEPLDEAFDLVLVRSLRNERAERRARRAARCTRRSGRSRGVRTAARAAPERKTRQRADAGIAHDSASGAVAAACAGRWEEKLENGAEEIPHGASAGPGAW